MQTEYVNLPDINIKDTQMEEAQKLLEYLEEIQIMAEVAGFDKEEVLV